MLTIACLDNYAALTCTFFSHKHTHTTIYMYTYTHTKGARMVVTTPSPNTHTHSHSHTLMHIQIFITCGHSAYLHVRVLYALLSLFNTFPHRVSIWTCTIIAQYKIQKLFSEEGRSIIACGSAACLNTKLEGGGGYPKKFKLLPRQ